MVFHDIPANHIQHELSIYAHIRCSLRSRMPLPSRYKHSDLVLCQEKVQMIFIFLLLSFASHRHTPLQHNWSPKGTGGSLQGSLAIALTRLSPAS